MMINNNNPEKNIQELKPIKFLHENGTTTYIQPDYPKDYVMGDLWLSPNENEWAKTNYEFYNSVQSYDNRLY